MASIRFPEKNAAQKTLFLSLMPRIARHSDVRGGLSSVFGAWSIVESFPRDFLFWFRRQRRFAWRRCAAAHLTFLSLCDVRNGLKAVVRCNCAKRQVSNDCSADEAAVPSSRGQTVISSSIVAYFDTFHFKILEIDEIRIAFSGWVLLSGKIWRSKNEQRCICGRFYGQD